MLLVVLCLVCFSCLCVFLSVVVAVCCGVILIMGHVTSKIRHPLHKISPPTQLSPHDVEGGVEEGV